MPATTVSTETMQDILTKLEDVYNSQAALNQKLAIIQMALEDAPDIELEAAMFEAYSNANQNAELIKKATDHYQMTVNAKRMGNT